MKSIYCYLTALIAFFVFVAAGKHDKPAPSLPKEIKKKLVFVREGKAVVDKDSVLVNSFFMSRCEVSNADFRQFLNHLRSTGQQDVLRLCEVDSAAWRRSSSYNEPYVQHYFSHPAYDNYPVVNISYDAAILYARWYAELIQNKLGPDYVVSGSLPSRAQWIRASRGDQHGFTYSWGGPYLMNSKGVALCNYMQYGDQAIHTNPETGKAEVVAVNSLGVAGNFSDNADIMAPVLSYFPNQYGLYNMNGNVAEMLAERGMAAGGSWMSTGYDVRTESTINYHGVSPEIGFRPIFRISSAAQ